MKRLLCLMISVVVACSSQASEYIKADFKSTKEANAYYHFLGELRCLVCQGQSIRESNAPFAIDLRKRIYHLWQQGRSEAQITSMLRARFGDGILLSPPINGRTIALWLLPIGLLFLGMFYLLWLKVKLSA